MKLKVSETELRLRLTRGEIEQLAREGRLEQVTRLTPDRALTLAIEASDTASGFDLAWSADRLVVSMPARDAAQWARSGQVGFAATLPHGLTLRLEWDFKEGARRERPAPPPLDEDELPRDAGPEARDEPSD